MTTFRVVPNFFVDFSILEPNKSFDDVCEAVCNRVDMILSTISVKTLSEFVIQLETRISDKYRIILFRGQNTNKPLIPNIARHYFKKSREIDEKRMLEEFHIHSVQYLTYYPKNELEQLTIAQHHGLPTRLLDWTENALAALYFAVSEEPAENDTAVVWVISIERDSSLLITTPTIDVFGQKEVRFFKPASIIPRISSQSGWFTLHPYRQSGQYLRADKDYDQPIRINKVVIENGCSRAIRNTLETCGINKHSIFRDLDSLGSYVFDKYKQERN